MRNHNELIPLEKSIVPIYEKNCIDGSTFHEQVVNARELWQWLESKQEFANWIKDRIAFGFVEGKDYLIKLSNRSDGKAGKPKTDYIITIRMAQHLGMIERSEKGMQIRDYFIEAEKRYRELQLIRTRSKAERRLFTDILRDVLPESPNKKWAYKNFTDLVYKHVTGYSAKQLREQYDKPDDYNVRELLTPQQLKEVLKYESIIQGLLQLGQDYQGVKAILDNPALYLPEKVA